MLLAVSNVSKSYPGLPVLHHVSFAAHQGEIVCLLGASGCGKTTLLHVIAGLVDPDTGRVEFAGSDLAGVPAHRRNFGLMFQDFALFPHKDVAANVAFGLRMQDWPATKVATRVQEMLALVGLTGYERRRVTELSGGEQQRVALARSLAPDPRLLMLDEPLGSLDRTLREQLMNDLRAILKRVGVTALYVTHDQEEAFAIADRVLIFQARLEAGEGGRIVQVGKPQEVYRRPKTPYVARFLGFHNLLEGAIVGHSALVGGLSAGSPRDSHFGAVVATQMGQLIVGDADQSPAEGERVTVLIRPEAADIIAPDAAVPEANVFPGRLVSCSFRGSFYLVRTEHVGGVLLTCEVPATDSRSPEVGAPLRLWLDPRAIAFLQS
jgi:ABC-type Fe3+/spermidine/putrescine transport system ATPase subunit